MKNPSIASRVATWEEAYRRTDRNDETNIRFAQFGGGAQKNSKGYSMLKECYLRVSVYSQKKKRYLSVRHRNGDVIIECRLDIEFFNITCMKFDFNLWRRNYFLSFSTPYI